MSEHKMFDKKAPFKINIQTELTLKNTSSAENFKNMIKN